MVSTNTPPQSRRHSLPPPRQNPSPRLLRPRLRRFIELILAGYLFSSSIITSMERYAKEVAEKVLEKASTLCTDFNSELKVEKMVENGDPRDVICEVAARLKVDLVVVGSHGYGPIKRAFLGSVSSQCAQTLKCPILIVKNPN
ncbi:uncharacterized protein LOC127262180 isoform X3 [Andrographis paniculata]|uniref:uncharacterized protein LOC127262180 isoform X3 n=1 Tax=Andrographis paniculata TaxID=175694 RepID=UPI0021E755E4|nr:uncharacterized protein LOC127262180 isoform X3 [Andrographis paniculata]